MYLGILNKTVILIDSEFLNERIEWNLNFYKQLYPNKKFKKINLGYLLYQFAINVGVEEPGQQVDILFAYTLSNSVLKHCTPNNLAMDISDDGAKIKTDKGIFFIRAFFADENETCSEHFINMLRMAYYDAGVSRIIMIADNSELNFELKMMYNQSEKDLFLIKLYRGTKISVPIRYANVNYPIAYALGLNRQEI